MVQAARQYNKNTVQILKKEGFIECNDDPCLYMKKTEKDAVYIASYMDDNLVIGNPETIEEEMDYFERMV